MDKIVTGKVRFSYVNVFEPKSVNGGDEKYSVTLLIPKSDTNTHQKIMAEINKTIQNSITDVFKGITPANLHLPIYDGDGLRPSGEPFGAECKECWVMSAKSNVAPEVVDANRQFIISKNEFYSGCYGRASINFYAYNQNGNKGIGCGLCNVQKLEDGQPLGGRTSAAEDFATPYQPEGQAIAQQPAVQQASMQPQYQQPVIQPNPYQTPIQPQINPITGQEMTPQTTVNGIYGVD